jgi:mono/diheme cytochrome c family protein
LLVLLPAACARPAASNAGAALPPEAKTLYIQYCAECHGEKGEGQPNWKRPNAEGVYPAPPHNSSGHTWHHADDQLLAIIAQGGSLPKTQMPAFDATLTEAEMQLVLAYIKTFWGEEERAFQEQVTRQSQGN